MDSRIAKLRAHQGWLGNRRRSARLFDVQCIINMCGAQLYLIFIKGVSTLFSPDLGRQKLKLSNGHGGEDGEGLRFPFSAACLDFVVFYNHERCNNN